MVDLHTADGYRGTWCANQPSGADVQVLAWLCHLPPTSCAYGSLLWQVGRPSLVYGGMMRGERSPRSAALQDDCGPLVAGPDGVWRIIAPAEPGQQRDNPGGEAVHWTPRRDGGVSRMRAREFASGSAASHESASPRTRIPAHRRGGGCSARRTLLMTISSCGAGDSHVPRLLYARDAERRRGARSLAGASRSGSRCADGRRGS